MKAPYGETGLVGTGEEEERPAAMLIPVIEKKRVELLRTLTWHQSKRRR